jgi:hypothetical protein
VDETEFAGGEVIFLGAYGWAEGAAEDGAVLVEVAGAGGEVEDGAGLVVGELFEEDCGFVVLVEDARSEVAGEPGVEAGQGILDAGVDVCGFLRVGLFELGKAFSKTSCVFVGYGEDADAALGTAGMADEVRAASTVGVGYCGVYDLDKGVDSETSAGRLHQRHLRE